MSDEIDPRLDILDATRRQAIAEERERCARIADSVATLRGGGPYQSGHFQACRDIAIKIRYGCAAPYLPSDCAMTDQSHTTKIYDVADDPLFGIPACSFFANELCVTGCEYGIAGDCLRRLTEDRSDDE